MARYSTKPGDKSDFETTFSHNLGQAGIRDFGAFEFFTSGTTAIFEGAIEENGSDSFNVGASSNILKVAYFTQERARGYNTKANPEAPDHAAKHSHYFMSKKLTQKGRSKTLDMTRSVC